MRLCVWLFVIFGRALSSATTKEIGTAQWFLRGKTRPSFVCKQSATDHAPRFLLWFLFSLPGTQRWVTRAEQRRHPGRRGRRSRPAGRRRQRQQQGGLRAPRPRRQREETEPARQERLAPAPRLSRERSARAPPSAGAGGGGGLPVAPHNGPRGSRSLGAATAALCRREQRPCPSPPALRVAPTTAEPRP